jgi:hypothetical protein
VSHGSVKRRSSRTLRAGSSRRSCRSALPQGSTPAYSVGVARSRVLIQRRSRACPEPPNCFEGDAFCATNPARVRSITDVDDLARGLQAAPAPDARLQRTASAGGGRSNRSHGRNDDYGGGQVISGECSVETLPPSDHRVLLQGLRVRLDLRIVPRGGKDAGGGDAGAAGVWRIEDARIATLPLGVPLAYRRVALISGIAVLALSIGVWLARPSTSPSWEGSEAVPTRSLAPTDTRPPLQPGAGAGSRSSHEVGPGSAANTGSSVAPRIGIYDPPAANVPAAPAPANAVTAPGPLPAPKLGAAPAPAPSPAPMSSTEASGSASARPARAAAVVAHAAARAPHPAPIPVSRGDSLDLFADTK